MNTWVKSRNIIFVLWCCLLLIGCKSQQQKNVIVFEENPPFTIAEAQFQRWTTGKDVRESGWNLYVTFDHIEPTVAIKEIFFKDFRSDIKNSTKFPNRYMVKLTDEKSDFVMHSDPLKEAANTPPRKPIFQLEATEAVIKYRFQSEEKYYKITDLKQKNAISYPR